MAIPEKIKVLILNTSQFGYHTDTFMYCKYLDKVKFEVSYFCFDMFMPRVELDGILVYYIPSIKNRGLRYLVFIRTMSRLLHKQKFDIIL